MKKFENFLKEDPNKPIKQFGDNVTSSARVKATGDIIKSGNKATASQKKVAKDVLGNLNRFFSDKPDSETLKAKSTGDEKTFKAKNTDKTLSTKQIDTAKVNARSAEILKANNKKPIKGGKTVDPVTAYDYKTKTSKPVEPLSKRMSKAVERGIKSGDIPQDALIRKPKTKNVVKPLRKPSQPSFEIKGTTKTTTPPSKPTFTKTNNPTFKDFSKKANVSVKSSGPSLPNFVTKTQKGNVITQSTSSALPGGGKSSGPSLPNFIKNKPRTNPVSSFIRKGLEVQGIVDPKPKNVKPFTRTTNTITRNFSKAVKPSKLGRFVRGVSGRLIAPAFAIKDYLDTTAKTQAQGYSKNYSRAKGITRALSGYIGGGIGATVGGAVGLGVPGSIAGGVAGYHYGQKLGDKAFDYTQKFVSGKKTFKDLRKDVDSGLKKLNLKNKQY